MSDVSTLLASLIIIIPGYVAISVFSYVIGSRSREFVASTVWSVLAAALLYAVFDKIGVLVSKLGLTIPGVTIAQVLKTDLKEGRIGFGDTSVIDIIYLSLSVSMIGAMTGFFAGKLVRSRSFNFLSRRYTGHSYNPDIWNEYFIDDTHPCVYIKTKDGKELLANLAYASEVPSNKGVILYDVSFVDENTGELEDIELNGEPYMFVPGDNINYIIRYGGYSRDSLLERVMRLFDRDEVLLSFITLFIISAFILYYTY
ncbi:DUF6338 family protein [Deinococcus sp. YIM 134068]|uniref:DUF6338 family protein n=1 Tax=Deinococcus lichenicola TaxID=3118910 RepID=UPI002F9421DB